MSRPGFVADFRAVLHILEMHYSFWNYVVRFSGAESMLFSSAAFSHSPEGGDEDGDDEFAIDLLGDDGDLG